MSLDYSVIIPTFRRPKELREAIESVLRQAGVTVEVIVIDDSAEGDAEPVVAAIGDPRVRYRKMPEPSGGRPALVRNFGWREATGKLCHFLDDDDLVPEGHYFRVKQAFDAHPNVGVVFGIVKPFAAASQPLEHEQQYFADAARRARRCRWLGRRRGYGAQMFFAPTMMVCSTAVIRREHVEALGGFDTSLRLNEDVALFARAMRRFGAFFLDEVALYYRIGPSLMHSRDNDDEIIKTYQSMHQQYRRTWGTADFLAMKVLARSVMRWM